MKWETVTVWRSGDPVHDGQGGWEPSEKTSHTVRGQVQPLSVRDELVARTDGANLTYAFFCDYDADIRFPDEVEFRDGPATVEGIRTSVKDGVYKRVLLKVRQE
jgi:hypothetical protein